MSRRKEPAIPNELLDQLLAGGAAREAFDPGWTCNGFVPVTYLTMPGLVTVLRRSLES